MAAIVTYDSGWLEDFQDDLGPGAEESVKWEVSAQDRQAKVTQMLYPRPHL